MNELNLIDALFFIKAIEVIIQGGLLTYLLYLFIKSLTWNKIKKEISENLPVLSLVFIISFISNFTR